VVVVVVVVAAAAAVVVVVVVVVVVATVVVVVVVVVAAAAAAAAVVVVRGSIVETIRQTNLYQHHAKPMPNPTAFISSACTHTIRLHSICASIAAQTPD